MAKSNKNTKAVTFTLKECIARSIILLYAKALPDDEKITKGDIVESLLMEGFKARGIDPEEYGSTT